MQKRYLIAATAALLSLPLAASAADKKKGGAFAAADKDGDKQVSKEEYLAAMTGEGKKMKTGAAEKRFAQLDKDGSGGLSQQEWNAGMGGKKGGKKK